MPSFDSVKVKHLSVKHSETTPVDIVSRNDEVLYGKDSGKTFQVTGVPAGNWTITLPDAEKGRYVTFVVTGTNYGDLTINVKKTDQVINGEVLNSNSNLITQNNVYQLNLSQAAAGAATITAVGVDNTTVAFTIYFPLNLLVSNAKNIVIDNLCAIGSKLEFICLKTGVWSLTGTAYSPTNSGVRTA